MRATIQTTLATCLTFLFLAGVDVNAQTNEMLVAPAISPAFQIATIEIEEDNFIIGLGQTVTTSQPIESPESENVEIIEILSETEIETNAKGDGRMQMNYTVSIPYTESITQADGSIRTVQRIRTETRTRMVTVSDAKNKVVVEYESSNMMLHSTPGAEGSLTPTFHKQKISKAIPKDHQLVRKKVVTTIKIPKKDIAFYDVEGNGIQKEDAIKKIGEKAPLVLHNKPGKALDPFYLAILNEQTLVAHIEFETLSKAIADQKK